MARSIALRAVFSITSFLHPRVVLPHELHDFPVPSGDLFIVFRHVGKDAARAILVALFRIPEIAAAALAQRVQGAVAKEAVEAVRIVDPVTWEILTFQVLEKGIVLRLLVQGGFLPVYQAPVPAEFTVQPQNRLVYTGSPVYKFESLVPMLPMRPL